MAVLFQRTCLCSAAGDQVDGQDADITSLHRKCGETEVSCSVSVLQRASLRRQGRRRWVSTSQNAANKSDCVMLTCVSPPLYSESGERALWCEGAATRHGAHLERVQCATQWHSQRLHQPERNKAQQAAGGRAYCSGETRPKHHITIDSKSQEFDVQNFLTIVQMAATFLSTWWNLRW